MADYAFGSNPPYELAMDQLGAVSGGTKGRLVEVEITKPATTVPGAPVPVPIPYPNLAKSSDAADTSTTVEANGKKIMLKSSTYSSSTGDEAGSIGGVVSNCTKGKAQFIAYSFDVKAEGQNVPRNMDMMKHNGSSSYNAVG